MSELEKLIEYLDLNRKMIISTYNMITQLAPLTEDWRVTMDNEQEMKIRELLISSNDMINETYYFFFPDDL